MIALLIFYVSLDLNPPEVERNIKLGLEHAYVEQFDSARFYFDIIVRDYPDSPAGYFMNAALLQLKMMDECRFGDESEYYRLMRKTISLSEKIVAGEDNVWARFYLANAYIYQAVYKGYRKDYFETFRLGVKGGRMMQELARDDTLFYDAYLAAGTFEYFWARASRYLPFFNLGGGDIEGAIAKLHIAAEKSMYSGPTARNSLVFVYCEEAQYDKAESIANGLLAEYPKSKTFLWNKADLEFRRKNYEAAAKAYEILYMRYVSDINKNYANLAQCRLYIGKCFVELGKKDDARINLKEVIKLKEHSDNYPQIKGYCREAYALLNRLL
ncbi:MAG: tetratricopeptide repeat protein [candidate division WOR-3 bacterium]|nr:MAG: tetratricopeptide repeat protein [candidate division WOR-3 bacterium]